MRKIKPSILAPIPYLSPDYKARLKDCLSEILLPGDGTAGPKIFEELFGKGEVMFRTLNSIGMHIVDEAMRKTGIIARSADGYARLTKLFAQATPQTTWCPACKTVQLWIKNHDVLATRPLGAVCIYEGCDGIVESSPLYTPATPPDID